MIGNLFYGSDGYMAMDQSGFRIYQGERKKLALEEKVDPKEAVDPTPHFANFLDAVRRASPRGSTGLWKRA